MQLSCCSLTPEPLEAGRVSNMDAASGPDLGSFSNQDATRIPAKAYRLCNLTQVRATPSGSAMLSTLVRRRRADTRTAWLEAERRFQLLCAPAGLLHRSARHGQMRKIAYRCQKRHPWTRIIARARPRKIRSARPRVSINSPNLALFWPKVAA